MTQQTDTLKSVYNIQELITRSSLESTPNRVDGGLADYRIPHPKTLYYLRPLGGRGEGGGPHWGRQGRAAYHMASVTEVDDSAVWFKHFSELYTIPPSVMVGGLESACAPHAFVHVQMKFKM